MIILSVNKYMNCQDKIFSNLFCLKFHFFHYFSLGEVISYNTSKSPNLEQINDMINKVFDKNNNLEGLNFIPIKDGNTNVNLINKD